MRKGEVPLAAEVNRAGSGAVSSERENYVIGTGTELIRKPSGHKATAQPCKNPVRLCRTDIN